MLTYCLSRRKHTGNIRSKKVTMTNKVITQNKDVLIACLINPDFENKKLIKKFVGIILILNYLCTNHYRTR